KTYTLSHFTTKEEAARAHDNCAFYATARELVDREPKLNFPQEYSGDSKPAPTDRTQEVLSDVQDQVNQPKIQGLGRTELIAHLKRQITEGRAAQAMLRRLESTV